MNALELQFVYNTACLSEFQARTRVIAKSYIFLNRSCTASNTIRLELEIAFAFFPIRSRIPLAIAIL